MSVSYWMDQNSNAIISSDVVIVGGGIAGLSTAYWLQKEDPNLKIVILEKYELGDGATGRNAGFITCGSVEHFNRLVTKHGIDEASRIWKFSEDNLQLLKDHLIFESNSKAIANSKNDDNASTYFSASRLNLQFEEKGSFSLASTENEFTELKKSAEIMAKFKINVEILNDLEISKRLGVEKFVGGIKYINDASVHPLQLLKLLKNKLLQISDGHSSFEDSIKNKTSEYNSANLKIIENAEVFSIESKDGNKIIKTKKGTFEAPIVVLATNGYSALLNSFFEDKIFPTRGQILATEKVPLFMEGPCYANFVLDYFRQLPTGEVIIGGFRQLQKDTEVGYSDQTSKVIQQALDQFLLNHIPSVAKAKITHRWAGIMGFSVDGQPLVGCLPNDPQIYFVGGFTAHGLGLAFHSAKTLVDCMYDRPIPNFISAKRFSVT